MTLFTPAIAVGTTGETPVTLNTEAALFNVTIPTVLPVDEDAMFSGCSGLTSLSSIRNWDTGNVTNMCSMFNSCKGLTTVDISGCDTAKVTDMSYMFETCTGLTSLDLSSFDTSNVIEMPCIFSDYTGLTLLDLSSFDMSSVLDADCMFLNCTSITTAYARTQADIDRFNDSHYTDKPANVNFIVK